MLLQWYKQQNPHSTKVVPSYKTLTDELKIPANNGISQTDIEEWLQEHNWTYTATFNTIESLKQGLHNGPIAISLYSDELDKKSETLYNYCIQYWNSKKPKSWSEIKSWRPYFHFIVLIGYDSNGFTYYNPEDTGAYKRTLSYDDFTYRWLPDKCAWQLLS